MRSRESKLRTSHKIKEYWENISKEDREKRITSLRFSILKDPNFSKRSSITASNTNRKRKIDGTLDIYLEKARQKAKLNPRNRKGSQHRDSKSYDLIDPFGNRHQGMNILEFIRTHQNLFDPLKLKGMPVHGDPFVRGAAYSGLTKVVRSEKHSWYKWRQCTISSEVYSHWQKTTPEIDKIVNEAVHSFL